VEMRLKLDENMKAKSKLGGGSKVRFERALLGEGLGPNLDEGNSSLG